MDDLTVTAGVASGSGLIGLILGWLGFKNRLTSIEKDIKDLRKNVRYDVTCKEINHGISIRLNDIQKMNTEIRNDIKEILKKK